MTRIPAGRDRPAPGGRVGATQQLANVLLRQPLGNRVDLDACSAEAARAVLSIAALLLALQLNKLTLLCAVKRPGT